MISRLGAALAVGVVVWTACPIAPDTQAPGPDGGGPPDAAGALGDASEAPLPDGGAALDATSEDASGPDGSIEVPGDGGRDDGGSALPGDGGMPFGWVKPRCGDQLVDSCADCAALPFACGACTVSANCVADCAKCSGATTACGAASTCNDAQTPCASTPFCGCSPELKECRGASGVTCVSSCAAECVGQATNAYGTCSAQVQWSCPDPGGSEYLCAPTRLGQSTPSMSCVASCDACSPATCISQSCGGGAPCADGFLPGYSLYVCDYGSCCSSGVYCPVTASCVSDCAHCGYAGQYQGACGDRGVCVTDCATCFPDTPGPLDLQVCAGVCRDLSDDWYNCGACGKTCGPTANPSNCSLGHCCVGVAGKMPPYSWCDACNCCIPGSSANCLSTACAVVCL